MGQTSGEQGRAGSSHGVRLVARMSHIAWSRMYGTGGNIQGVSYNCTDGNDGGTALTHLPAGKFDVFPRLWKWWGS